LADIASSKGLSMKELIKEIEAIINSGTKLNIDYYIEQTIDEEYIDEIYDYFYESEEGSIDDAIDELGEEYFSEEEIRLVRVKFMSEMAN
jgi:ATP-dependent DNA helicase RecQ